jgi:Ca2+-binding RTX toxin-like protein
VALFEIFHTPSDTNSDDGVVTVASDRLIQVVAGSMTYDYYGTGLSYNSSGELVGGAFVAFEIWDSSNGGLQARISGLNVDVFSFFETASSSDPDALDRLLLAGNDTLIGSAGDDSLEGFAGADSIFGGAGNDLLDGGDDAAVDTLAGGAGNDTYVVHNYWTVIAEAPGGGVDTVRTSTNYTLNDNFENLVLIGRASSGAGNALPNVITGNDLGNILIGGGGADTLIGGLGNDWFNVDNAGDVVTDTGGNDTVDTSVENYVLPAGIETLYVGASVHNGSGNASANLIGANNLDNRLFGLAGNDTIEGGTGNDTIDGGDGIDHAVFYDKLAGYTISPTSTGFNVTSKAEIVNYVDALTNIERLDFADYHVALDIHGNAGMAYRLYQAAFDRAPDLGGLGYQMHDLDSGHSLAWVAGNFIASPEFQRTYGNVDNAQFVTLLYRNVLDREPDAGGLQFHLDEFAHGETRAGMLTHFSESLENQANVIGAIQDGMVYVW